MCVLKHSQVKFAFACIGTFLAGIVVASLGAGRRLIWDLQKKAPGSHVVNAKRIAMLFLAFSIQLAIGYFLMLLVMT
jgi:hypothetical protein